MKSLRCLVPFVIVALLMAGVLYLVEAPVTTAATCTVTTTADSGAGSLREKLADATCDTITFDASLAGQTITLTSQLVISRSVTVDGRGLSAPLALSGNQAVRVVKVITGQVTLAGLTLTHGNAPAETEVCISWGTSYRCGGGLLVSTGAAVTLTASTIVSNTADACGGGLANMGTLVVLSSTIANNAGYCAGGILSGNGQHLATTLVVRDSTFSNNIANDIGYAALGGGAILIDAGSLTVENSVFQNNHETAVGGGGAIHAELYLDKLTVLVRNSLFTHNSASLGGVMYMYGADLTLEGNLFADNTARAAGGAVYASGNMTLTNNTFSGNIALEAGGMEAWQGVVTLTNNTFSDNAAKDTGGLFLTDHIAVTLRNNLIANSGDGGDCRIEADNTVTIAENTNNLIEDGSCSTGGVNFQSGDPRLGPLADNGGLLVAGQAISTHALLEDSPALDTGNNATCPAYDQRHLARPQGATCDRGAYERGPLQLGLRVTPDSEAPYHGPVTYTLVLTNTGAATDPGLWLTDTLPPGVTFESWIISPTGTTRSGDQLFWQGSLPSGATRTWVFAARNTGDFDLPGDYGDTLLNMAQVSSAGNLGSWAQTALQVTCGALTVQNYANDGPCSLRDVAAKAPADATIVFRPVLAGKTLLQVYHPKYSWQTPPYATLLITKNLTVDASALAAPFTIDGNLAARLIYVADAAHLTLNNLTLMRGNGLSAIGPNGHGGALLIRRGAAVTLTHVSVLSNTVGLEGAGGGIDVYGGGATLTVLDSVLAGNSTTHGGAIYASAYEDYAKPITVTIRRSTFAGNVASRGGGILLNGGMTPIAAQYLLIEDSTFKDNQVTELGGGIACWLAVNNPIATIKNSTFSGNVAGRGGGIFASGDCPMEITNSTFISNTGNSGNYISGGLSSDTVLTVTHSTFSGNSGGIGNPTYGSLFLRNTIIANSTSAADCTVGTLVANVNNLIEDGSCSAGGVNFQTGDPLLGSLAANGGRTPTMALLAGSPAIDSADTATCLPTDQRGVARPQGAACDRGAYEAAPDLTLTKSVVPVAPLYHSVVTYTVNITNSGIVTDAGVLFTDTLPASVTFGAWLEQPAGAVAAGNAITWTGEMIPGGALTFRFTALHTGAPREIVTNTAYFSGSVQVGHAAAGFQVTAYVITPAAGVGGVITPSMPQVINPGEDRVFTIAPNYGYHILDAGVDGLSVGTVTSYTFNNITANHTISAAFALNTYVITPTAGANGSISPSTPQMVDHGESITFTIASAAGYHINDVGVDGASVGVLTSYTFSNVTASHILSAAFTLNTYTITPTVGTGGSITPGTPQAVSHGDDITFTIVSDYGYHILNVGVDGVSMGAVNVYTFTHVTADHTISATFALNEYVLTAGVIGQGQVTRTPDQSTYLYGSVVTLTAVPQPDWYFGQWLGDASGVLTQTTVLMNANKVVTATFLNTPPTYYTLTLSLTGSGLITPTVGAHSYLSGTVVPLSASPEAGWLFVGWSGNADCADGSVTMTANKMCTATFARYQIYLPLVLKY